MLPIRVRKIRARPVLAPIKRPPLSASGAIPGAALVLIDLETDQGITGRSYVFGFAPWTLKPIVGRLQALGALIEGDALAPLALEAKLRASLTLLGTPGLVGIALGGIDMAAWDALAVAQGLPLVRLLGGEPRPVSAYNSCGLWIQPVDTLADEAEQLVAEGGFRALKLRLGRDDPAQDLAAVRAVRARLGDEICVMADFNQRLSASEATRRGHMLDDEGLSWFEEPMRHDDYAAYSRLCRALRTPVQLGENFVDAFQFECALRGRSLDYAMPDLQRIGGVSGWLRAAALAQAHGVEMSSHIFPEFSAHLLPVTPTGHWLEYVDWAAPMLEQPLVLKHGQVEIPARPGAGISWDESAVSHYAL